MASRVLVRSVLSNRGVLGEKAGALSVMSIHSRNRGLRNTNTEFSRLRRWMSVFRSHLSDIEIPDNMKFFDYISKDFHKFGNNPALIFPPRDVTYSFSELSHLVRRLGSGLTRHGLKQGDVMCLFMKNNAEYLPMVYAISNIGGVVTTSNPAYTPEELSFQLKDARATYIMTTPDLLETVWDAVEKSGEIKEIFVVGEQEGYTSFDDIAADDGSAYPDDVTMDLRNDIAFLLYSSGTTGLPKGVMLTHHSLVANTAQTYPLLGYKGGEMSLNFLPLFHCFGLVPGTAASLICGDGVVILDRFDGKEFLQCVQDYRVKHIPVVPPVITFFAKSDMVYDYDVSSVNDVICGAAPLSADMQQQVLKKHNIKCRQGYGMTESSPVITLDAPNEDPVAGASGVILPNTEIKIIDVESGEALGLHQEGEIVCRGPQVMKGYLNNPSATEHTIRDGWLYTGDVGYVDETNRLFVVDRVKELIKYKGYQVAPAELEGILGEHPDIADNGVVGLEDEECGEVPKAFVVLKNGKQITEKQVQDFVADRVAKFKRLKGGVEFVDEIPRAASGKILRRILRQR